MKVHALALFLIDLIVCASGCWLLTPPPTSSLPFVFYHHFRILFWTLAKTPLRITLSELDKENSARFALEYLTCVSALLYLVTSLISLLRLGCGRCPGSWLRHPTRRYRTSSQSRAVGSCLSLWRTVTPQSFHFTDLNLHSIHRYPNSSRLLPLAD